MITKERLKELIKQGATIYSYSGWGGIFEEKLMSNHFVGIADDKVSLMQRYNGYEQDLVDYIDDLYETKAEAEWQAEFGCIERVERLELPTWEEFLEIEKLHSFKSKEGKLIVYFRDNNTIFIEDEDWNILREPLTKENYTKACRKAKELFLKGNAND